MPFSSDSEGWLKKFNYPYQYFKVEFDIFINSKQSVFSTSFLHNAKNANFTNTHTDTHTNG